MTSCLSKAAVKVPQRFPTKATTGNNSLRAVTPVFSACCPILLPPWNGHLLPSCPLISISRRNCPTAACRWKQCPDPARTEKVCAVSAERTRQQRGQDLRHFAPAPAGAQLARLWVG